MTTDITLPEGAPTRIARAMAAAGTVRYELGRDGNEPYVSDASITLIDEDGTAVLHIDLNANHGPASHPETARLAIEAVADMGGKLEVDDDLDDLENPFTANITWL